MTAICSGFGRTLYFVEWLKLIPNMDSPCKPTRDLELIAPPTSEEQERDADACQKAQPGDKVACRLSFGQVDVIGRGSCKGGSVCMFP